MLPLTAVYPEPKFDLGLAPATDSMTRSYSRSLSSGTLVFFLELITPDLRSCWPERSAPCPRLSPVASYPNRQHTNRSVSRQRDWHDDARSAKNPKPPARGRAGRDLLARLPWRVAGEDPRARGSDQGSLFPSLQEQERVRLQHRRGGDRTDDRRAMGAPPPRHTRCAADHRFRVRARRQSPAPPATDPRLSSEQPRPRDESARRRLSPAHPNRI